MRGENTVIRMDQNVRVFCSSRIVDGDDDDDENVDMDSMH